MPVVSSARYSAGRKVADLPLEDVSDCIGDHSSMVWVALVDPTEAELTLIQQEFALHELAIEDARHGHQRPKVEEYGDTVFAVFQTFDVKEDNTLQAGELEVFVGANFVISLRRNTTRPFTEVRARAERQPEFLSQGPGFVFYALMDAVVDRYFPVLEALAGRLDQAEERVFAVGLARESIRELYELKQDLMLLKHAVSPLLEAISQLNGMRTPALAGATREYFRDIYDHLRRLDQEIESERDMIGTAMSASLSLVQLQDNQTTKKLAAYAALVAVPTLIAGIYGMNFDHMPELDWRFGYPVVLGIMAAIDGYLFYRFRRSGWL